MQTETGKDQAIRSVAESLDRDAAAPSGKTAASPSRHAHYTHQLSDEDTEAVSRWLVRVVPLVFGAMLGSLAETIAIGLLAAAAVSLAFDLSMEGDSITLGLYRRFRKERRP